MDTIANYTLMAWVFIICVVLISTPVYCTISIACYWTIVVSTVITVIALFVSSLHNFYPLFLPSIYGFFVETVGESYNTVVYVIPITVLICLLVMAIADIIKNGNTGE